MSPPFGRGNDFLPSSVEPLSARNFVFRGEWLGRRYPLRAHDVADSADKPDSVAQALELDSSYPTSLGLKGATCTMWCDRLRRHVWGRDTFRPAENWIRCPQGDCAR
jgi:hypothetical protein